MASSGSPKVHPLIDRLAAYSWRLLVIAAVLAGLLWLLGYLWVVLLPLVLATFLSRILIVPNRWLRARRWPPALAASVTLIGFLLALATILGLIGVAIGQQWDQIGPTVTETIDDIEDWVVEDGPGNFTHADIQDARDDAREWIGEWLRSSGSTVASGVVVAFEVLVGIILGLVITFFALKDGTRFGAWLIGWLPAERRAHVEKLGDTAWLTLGGYLRGAALLGLLEGVVIGGTVALVGAKLAVPVAVITFIFAFIPFAGAIIAGAIAVLVTLGTSGFAGAVIVLVVAILVQQLDNDLLAPVIYGKNLELHPVVILLALTGGGAAFGVAGVFLAVPITAIVINVITTHRRLVRGDSEDSDDGDPPAEEDTADSDGGPDPSPPVGADPP